jgi:hypothetical protein
MVEADVQVILEKIPGINAMEPLKIVDRATATTAACRPGPFLPVVVADVVLHGRCLPFGGCRPVVLA